MFFFFKILETTTPNLMNTLNIWEENSWGSNIVSLWWCHWEIVRNETIMQPTGCFWKDNRHIPTPWQKTQPSSTTLKILIISEGENLFRNQNIWKFNFQNSFQIIVRVGASHLVAMCLVYATLHHIQYILSSLNFTSLILSLLLLLFVCVVRCVIVHQYSSIESYTAFSTFVYAESSRLS